MKKKIIAIGLAVMVSMSALSGCQGVTKSLGGSMTLDLPVNTKLEIITWKDDSLWYLTRPMLEDDIAEVHTFRQSSEWGVLEGTVTIVETKN